MYYTYAWLREDRTPFYIGKGKNNRAYVKHNQYFHPPSKDRILILKDNLTEEEEAFKYEIYMISVFGRKDLGTGILHNKTSGGIGSAGLIHTKEFIEKRIKNIRGRKLTEEHKKKIGDGNRGKKITEETRKKLSESHKGQKSHWKGKKFSDEHRRNIGIKTKERQPQLYYTYKITTPNNEVIITKNLKEYCNNSEYNLGYKCMIRVSNGQRNHHKHHKVEKI
jgi:hypothetical protein